MRNILIIASVLFLVGYLIVQLGSGETRQENLASSEKSASAKKQEAPKASERRERDDGDEGEERGEASELRKESEDKEAKTTDPDDVVVFGSKSTNKSKKTVKPKVIEGMNVQDLIRSLYGSKELLNVRSHCFNDAENRRRKLPTDSCHYFGVETRGNIYDGKRRVGSYVVATDIGGLEQGDVVSATISTRQGAQSAARLFRKICPVNTFNMRSFSEKECNKAISDSIKKVSAKQPVLTKLKGGIILQLVSNPAQKTFTLKLNPAATLPKVNQLTKIVDQKKKIALSGSSAAGSRGPESSGASPTRAASKQRKRSTKIDWVTKPALLKGDRGAIAEGAVVRINKKYNCVITLSEREIGGGYTSTRADGLSCVK